MPTNLRQPRRDVESERHTMTLGRWIKLVGPKGVLLCLADLCDDEASEEGADWFSWLEASSLIHALADRMPEGGAQ
jgi:hypothetical protein